MPEHLWVGFLRGMNVGGRRLTNDELLAAVQACGCDNADAYQASGNVVFEDERPEDELALALTDGLTESLGYAVPVFLRAADEVQAIVEHVPFGDVQLAASGSKPQVIFLGQEPSSAVLDETMTLVPEGDVLVSAGRELHWLPFTGVGESTLDFRRLDQLTGGTTVRTLGTVQRIAKKYLSPRT